MRTRSPRSRRRCAPSCGPRVLQALLARRVVVAAWRGLRCDRIESQLLGQGAEGRGVVDLGRALIRDGHGPRAFETLLRYRGSALAEFWRSLAGLKALQSEAQAGGPGLPLPDDETNPRTEPESAS